MYTSIKISISDFRLKIDGRKQTKFFFGFCTDFLALSGLNLNLKDFYIFNTVFN